MLFIGQFERIQALFVTTRRMCEVRLVYVSERMSECVLTFVDDRAMFPPAYVCRFYVVFSMHFVPHLSCSATGLSFVLHSLATTGVSFQRTNPSTYKYFFPVLCPRVASPHTLHTITQVFVLTHNTQVEIPSRLLVVVDRI